MNPLPEPPRYIRCECKNPLNNIRLALAVSCGDEEVDGRKKIKKGMKESRARREKSKGKSNSKYKGQKSKMIVRLLHSYF